MSFAGPLPVWDEGQSFERFLSGLRVRRHDLFGDDRDQSREERFTTELLRVQALLQLCSARHRRTVGGIIDGILDMYHGHRWWIVLFLAEHTERFLRRVSTLSDEGRKAWLETETVKIEKVDIPDVPQLRYHGDVACPGGSTFVRTITEDFARQHDSGGWESLRNEAKEDSDERKFTGVAVRVPELRPLHEYEYVGQYLDFIPWSHPEDRLPSSSSPGVYGEFAGCGYLFAMILQQLHLRWTKKHPFSNAGPIMVQPKPTDVSWMEYIGDFHYQLTRMEIRRRRLLRDRYTPRHELCPIFIEWMAYANAHYDHPDNFRGDTFFRVCHSALDHDTPWEFLNAWARRQYNPDLVSLKLVGPRHSGERSRNGASRSKPMARGRRGRYGRDDRANDEESSSHGRHFTSAAGTSRELCLICTSRRHDSQSCPVLERLYRGEPVPKCEHCTAFGHERSKCFKLRGRGRRRHRHRRSRRADVSSEAPPVPVGRVTHFPDPVRRDHNIVSVLRVPASETDPSQMYLYVHVRGLDRRLILLLGTGTEKCLLKERFLEEFPQTRVMDAPPIPTMYDAQGHPIPLERACELEVQTLTGEFTPCPFYFIADTLPLPRFADGIVNLGFLGRLRMRLAVKVADDN